jgi:hypothetical protein
VWEKILWCGRGGGSDLAASTKKYIKAKLQKEGWLPLRTDRFCSKQIKSSGKIGRRPTTQNLAPGNRVRAFASLKLLPGVSDLRYRGSNAKSQTGDAVDMAKMSSNGDTEELIEHMAPSWNLLYLPLSMNVELIVKRLQTETDSRGSDHRIQRCSRILSGDGLFLKLTKAHRYRDGEDSKIIS